MISVPSTIDLRKLLQTTLHTPPVTKNDNALSINTFDIAGVYIQPPKQHKKIFQKLLRAAMRKRARELNQYEKNRPLYGFAETVEQVSGNVSKLRMTVLRALNMSQPAQRSPEWFDMRRKRLTASEYHKMLGTPVARETLAFDKATALLYPERTLQRQHRLPSFDEARGWGTIFESVCVEVYTSYLRKDAVVEEFGLLPHHEHSFLGASPDGICNEQSAEEEHIGRILECKAPYSRKLKKGCIIPAHLAQIQGLLEVAGLPTGDYLECQFERLTKEQAHEYVCPPPATSTQPQPPPKTNVSGETLPIAVGYIVFLPGTPQSSFQYGKLNVIDDASVEASIVALECNDDERVAAEVVYWRLKDYQLLTVYRNKEWFDTELFPKLAETWKRVETLVSCTDVYETVAAERKKKKKTKQPNQYKTVYAFRN